MDSLTFSNGDYTAAVSAANTLASSASGTVSSNVNFWLLLAVGSTILGIIYILLRCLVRFGQYIKDRREDSLPLTAFDSLGESAYAGEHTYDGSIVSPTEDTWEKSEAGRHWIRSFRARNRKAAKMRAKGADLNSKRYKRATSWRPQDLPF